MYLSADQWNLVLWSGYSFLFLVTLLLAAIGRKPVAAALIGFLLTTIWWFAWSFRFRVPSWSDLSDPNILWLVFFLPFLVIGSIAATVIGRIVYSLRHRRRASSHITTTSTATHTSIDNNEVQALRKRGYRFVAIALLIELGRYVYLLKDASHDALDIAVWAASLIGAVLFGWGCLLYAKSKNFSPWWALLGVAWISGGPALQVLSILLFLLLVSAASRSVESVQVKSRSDT